MTADAAAAASDLARRAAELVDMSKEEWMRRRAEAEQQSVVHTKRPMLVSPPLYFGTRRSTYSDVVSLITTTRPVGGGARKGPGQAYASPLRHEAAREHLELSRKHEALAAENQRFLHHLADKRRARLQLETWAATSLQKVWRGYRLRRVVDQVREQMLLQRRIRRSLRVATDGLDLVIDSRDEELRQRKHERAAARRIQAAFRGLLGRRLGRRERLAFRAAERDRAATLMQSVVRMRTAGVAVEKMRLRHFQIQVQAAVVRIQACYRGFRGRQAARVREAQLQLVCAIVVQRALRGMLARRARAAELQRRQTERAQLATIAIQRVFRGRKGRRQVLTLRDQEERVLREACALALQRCYRGHLGRRLVHAELWRVRHESRLRAALHIQRAVRGWNGRQRFQLELVRQQEDIFTQTRLGKSQEVEDLFLGYTTEQEHAPTDTDKRGNTILLIAARWGHKKILRKCLRWRFNIDHRNAAGATALELAIRFSHGEVAQYLLSKKAELELHGRTLLHLAARNGLADVCEVLMNRGIKPNERDPDQRTPVHEACCSDDLPTLQKLLELTSDVNLQDKDGATPLHVASANGRNALVTALIESGADVSVADKQQRTPWRCALAAGHHETATLLRQQWAAIAGSVSLVSDSDREDVVAFARDGKAALVGEIVDAGLDVDFRDPASGNTLLLLAAGGGHLELVGECLRRGATASAANAQGQTALHLATAFPEVAAALLEQGLSLTAPDNAGRTPLHEGARHGHVFADAVRASQVPVTVADAAGRTPLHEAAALASDEHGDADATIAALVELGADVAAVDAQQRTPLHAAAPVAAAAAVQVLLSSGAQAAAADAEGLTPVHLAAAAGRRDALELLLRADGDANAVTGDGQTPGLLAARAGSVACLELLLDHGADISLADAKGCTMLHAALAGQHDAALSLLLNRGASLAEAYGTAEQGDLPLHLAARTGYAGALGALLQAAERPEAVLERRNALGETPLMTAVHAGHEAVVADLLAAGASAHPAQAAAGGSLLHLAAAAPAPSSGVIAMLVNAGLDVSARDGDGLAPLHVAAAADAPQIVAALLQNGAGIDERDGSDAARTPLHHAAEAGAAQAVAALVEAGADVAATYVAADGVALTAEEAAGRAGKSFSV